MAAVRRCAAQPPAILIAAMAAVQDRAASLATTVPPSSVTTAPAASPTSDFLIFKLNFNFKQKGSQSGAFGRHGWASVVGFDNRQLTTSNRLLNPDQLDVKHQHAVRRLDAFIGKLFRNPEAPIHPFHNQCHS